MARRRKAAAAEIEEVSDLEAEAPKPGLTIEAALVFVTFMALIVGVVLAQLALDKYFDMGMLH